MWGKEQQKGFQRIKDVNYSDDYFTYKNFAFQSLFDYR